MPFVQFLEPGSPMDLHVVILTYVSLQNAPCQEQKTQARFQSFSFLGWAPRRCHRLPQAQAPNKNSIFPTDMGTRLHCVGQQCCMALQEARKSPVLLASRLSLWEKTTWLAQAKAMLSSG